MKATRLDNHLPQYQSPENSGHDPQLPRLDTFSQFTNTPPMLG